MGFHILEHLGFQCPSEKVQLSNRCHEGLVIRNGKHDAFPTAVGVKILFGIRLELSLVTEIDEKLLAVQGIPNKGLPTVFRHKPVNDTKTQRRLAIQILKDLLNVGLVRIETLKTRDDEFRLTFHLFSACLWIRYIGLHVYRLNRLCGLGSVLFHGIVVWLVYCLQFTVVHRFLP